ncbi:copper transporter complex subunit Ctr4 [Yamadazyma tenuis]|uniref:Copper transport protein n=1 Tax=Candida tenuis (strain ATCC 10573 / BCRC 21748 / CBS 615 / JCM 9827 / NBRC 10315 / NRRL Y-1498 / VKM Y-70) TaxID=590646 RepID=G3B5W3_CANTC|nr:Ctr copper transporter [Yamadazyma tenuis ATCC 10573]EGV63319.1 Ctr copper transporter [Yamadazyma tenuis ATCC 10573]WEJ96862.1 copper transporter complex subunit Ctr4 [Yamadazyma tenuis]
MSLDPVVKMTMGGSSSSSEPACKISMLWNWYTIDSCFIAKSWHVRTRGMFAGSCIGVFLLVFFYQWLGRVAKEFDALTITASPKEEQYTSKDISSPLVYLVSHQWLLRRRNSSWVHHLIRSIIFTIQWGASYIIMLLFMYYNGYIIISCILGAFFGKLVFGMSEPSSTDEDVSCCKD